MTVKCPTRPLGDKSTDHCPTPIEKLKKVNDSPPWMEWDQTGEFANHKYGITTSRDTTHTNVEQGYHPLKGH